MNRQTLRKIVRFLLSNEITPCSLGPFCLLGRNGWRSRPTHKPWRPWDGTMTVWFLPSRLFVFLWPEVGPGDVFDLSWRKWGTIRLTLTLPVPWMIAYLNHAMESLVWKLKRHANECGAITSPTACAHMNGESQCHFSVSANAIYAVISKLILKFVRGTAD
jgi:hypothetical protein